jgi:uncharacterized protein (DUF924 family)
MLKLSQLASTTIVIVLSLLFYRNQMSLRTFTLNKSIWNATLYKHVRETWFAGLPFGAPCPRQEDIQRWFTSSAEAKRAFDKLCHTQFYSALESINASNFTLSGDDAASPFLLEVRNQSSEEDKTKTALSILILLDQMPRNLFRTKDSIPQVYKHYDPIALSITKSLLKLNPRPDLYASIRASPIYRQWLYMPLMHSEDVNDHKLLDELFQEVEVEVEGDESAKACLTRTKGEEKTHREIIEKFGRYPHRNLVLGRTNTKEEEEYMNSGGETFGVVK